MRFRPSHPDAIAARALMTTMAGKGEDHVRFILDTYDPPKREAVIAWVGLHGMLDGELSFMASAILSSVIGKTIMEKAA